MDPDVRLNWEALCKASPLSEALKQHFDVLCDGDSCRALLDEIATKAQSAGIADGVVPLGDGQVALEILFPSPYDPKEKRRLLCLAPKSGTAAPGLSASARRIFPIHHQIGVADESQWIMGFHGFMDDGSLANNPWFDPKLLLDPANAEILAQARAAGGEIRVPMFFDTSDWVMLHPTEKSTAGEPALCYVSHESGEVEPLTSRWSLGATLLRLIGSRLLGRHYTEMFKDPPP